MVLLLLDLNKLHLCKEVVSSSRSLYAWRPVRDGMHTYCKLWSTWLHDLAAAWFLWLAGCMQRSGWDLGWLLQTSHLLLPVTLPPMLLLLPQTTVPALGRRQHNGTPAQCTDDISQKPQSTAAH